MKFPRIFGKNFSAKVKQVFDYVFTGRIVMYLLYRYGVALK